MSQRFLITGLPRMRSAWLATLLNAIGVETAHDFDAEFGSLESLATWLRQPGVKGWCDPCAACMHPEFAAREFAECPVVIVDRDPVEAARALSRWAGTPVNLATMQVNMDKFWRSLKAATVLTVPYASLDSYDAVATLVKYCAGRVLPLEIWRRFEILDIQQHMPKARTRWQAAHP